MKVNDFTKQVETQSPYTILCSQEDAEQAAESINGFVRWSFDIPAKPVSVPLVYSWIPTELVERVLKEGILPGTFTGQSERHFAYADFNRNAWYTDGEPSPLTYERAGKLHNKFSLLGIEVTPSLKTYSWARFDIFDAEDGYEYEQTGYHQDPRLLVSSDLLPLDSFLGGLAASDSALREKYPLEPDEFWQASLIDGTLVPPGAFGHPEGSRFEYCEILLAFVPPHALRILVP